MLRVKGHHSFKPSGLILAVDTKEKRKKKQRGFGFLAPSVSESSSSVLIFSTMVHLYTKSSCRISGTHQSECVDCSL